MRHACKPYPRHLSQFFSSPRTLAIHGHKARQMTPRGTAARDMIVGDTIVGETSARRLVTVPDYADEVIFGLTSRPKTLPCKFFYDDHRSAFFHQITQLPEYYPTPPQLEILQDCSREIVQAIG